MTAVGLLQLVAMRHAPPMAAHPAGDFSVGATAGVVLFAAVFAVSMVQLRLLRSED